MKESWHDKEEEFLKKLEAQSNHMTRHYSKEFTYYNGLASKFNIPILIVSAINALTAIALGQFVEQNMVSILNAILSAGTGVLGSIQLYMKLNEKMTKALSSSIHMKRLALKISKELSIDRDQRSVEGVAFLNECFTEFTTTIEQGNPLEKSLENFLALTPPLKKDKGSAWTSLLTPRGDSPRDSVYEPKIMTLWAKLRQGHPSLEESRGGSASTPEEV